MRNIRRNLLGISLSEMCPNTELFLVRIFLYSARIHGVNLRIQFEYRRIQTRNNSVFGHFSRSVSRARKSVIE